MGHEESLQDYVGRLSCKLSVRGGEETGDTLCLCYWTDLIHAVLNYSEAC